MLVEDFVDLYNKYHAIHFPAESVVFLSMITHILFILAQLRTSDHVCIWKKLQHGY